MKEIVLYTSIYPYSLMAESFVGEELRIASQFDCKVTVVPIGKDTIKREIPTGIELDDSLCTRSILTNMRAILRSFKPLFLKEIFYNPKRPFKVKYLMDTVKYIYAANLVYEDVCKRAKNKNGIVFYSYWTSYIPIAFAEYKRKNPKTSHKFICRSHTFASYGTSVVPLYYPMRDFVFKYVDRFYAISSILLDKLKKEYPQHGSKFHLSRLGVKENYNPSRKASNRIEIVSCSSIIPLKRIDLIYNSIYNFAKGNPRINLKWTLIGDGPLLEQIRGMVLKNGIANLSVELKGGMENKDILSLYRNIKYNVLVLLSVREGLPVVLMEAISSGIPVIATNVGGIPDIVTKETGRLLEKDFRQEEFDEALQNVIDNTTLSDSCHAFYLKNFNSENNFRDFYSSLLSL